MATSSFAETLKFYRGRFHVSKNSLAKEIGINPSYLTRIENGQRQPPKKYIVEALCSSATLKMSPEEKAELLASAGYAPHNEWNLVYQLVHEVQSSPDLSDKDKEKFNDHVIDFANLYLIYATRVIYTEEQPPQKPLLFGATNGRPE